MLKVWSYSLFKDVNWHLKRYWEEKKPYDETLNPSHLRSVAYQVVRTLNKTLEWLDLLYAYAIIMMQLTGSVTKRVVSQLELDRQILKDCLLLCCLCCIESSMDSWAKILILMIKRNYHSIVTSIKSHKIFTVFIKIWNTIEIRKYQWKSSKIPDLHCWTGSRLCVAGPPASWDLKLSVNLIYRRQITFM